LALVRDRTFIYAVDMMKKKAFKIYESPYPDDNVRQYLTSVIVQRDTVEVHSLEYNKKISGIKRIKFSLSALKKLSQNLI
jgi:hypothetical protein